MNALPRISVLAIALAAVACGESKGPSKPDAAPQSDTAVPKDAALQSEAFKKATIASEQESWDLAAKYFEEAREAFPESPAVLYSLGAIHAKLSHWTSSIVYLRAYLEVQGAAGQGPVKPADVEDAIQRAEVALDKQVAELFANALATSDALPEGGHRINARSAVVGEMARAGLLDEARKVCREQPKGAPGALVNVAIACIKQGRIILAGKLFDLAEETALDEPLTPFYTDVIRGFPPTPQGAQDRRDWLKEIDEKHRAEEPQRRIHHQGINLLNLSVIEQENGFRGRAYRTWIRASELLKGIPDWAKPSGGSIPGDHAMITRTEKGIQLWNANGLIQFRPDGRDPEPESPAPMNWGGVIDPRLKRTASANGLVPPFSMKDANLFDATAELRGLLLREPMEIPPGLAQLAGKLGLAAEYLKENGRLIRTAGAR